MLSPLGMGGLAADWRLRPSDTAFLTTVSCSETTWKRESRKLSSARDMLIGCRHTWEGRDLCRGGLGVKSAC